MQTRINIAHEIAKKNLKRKTQYQKRYYYAKSRIKKIIIRQPVLLPDQTMKDVHNIFKQVQLPNLFIVI
jgi:hypothetical protein